LDIFVAKFDNTGNRIWDTFFGGSDSEDAHSISFDNSGNVILAGDTYSTNFPVTANAYQNTYNTAGDICMVKFDSSGQLLWSTYFGSATNEDAEAVDTDPNGNIYFAGYATGNGLPITSGLFQDTLSGNRDLIIGSFSPGGNLRWLTYAGGTAWDMPRDINVNSGGFVTATGESYSTDFPEVGNVFQNGNAGNCDAVYMVSDSLGNFSLSTLFGGTSFDAGQTLSFDGLSRILLAGNTSSADLNVSGDIFQANYNGQGDAFVKVIDSTSGVFLSIEENISLPEFYLYPNPSNGEIIITGIIPGEYRLEIYDEVGKLVLAKKIICETQFNLNEIPEISVGIFHLKLSNGSTNYFQPFVRF
jgi:hypothetical protein